MELGHPLTCSGLTYPEVSSKFYNNSICHLGNSVSMPWVIYFEAFYLHVVSSVSCIPVICPKLVLFLNLSGFFPWDLPVAKIFPEWVTDPEQGTSSGAIAAFSSWTGMLISKCVNISYLILRRSGNKLWNVPMEIHFRPEGRYCIHCADLHNNHSRSVMFFVHLLGRILSNSEEKCRKCVTTSFMREI